MQENVCVTILCNLYNSRSVSLFYAHSQYLAFPHPPPPIKQNRGEQICFVKLSANAEVFRREILIHSPITTLKTTYVMVLT